MNTKTAIALAIAPVPVSITAGVTGFFASGGTRRERFLTGAASLLATYVITRGVSNIALSMLASRETTVQPSQPSP